MDVSRPDHEGHEPPFLSRQVIAPGEAGHPAKLLTEAYDRAPYEQIILGDWDGAVQVFGAAQRGEEVRFFAGRNDPADESRFTIGYEIKGKGGTLEGRLGADDKVSLKVLDGPAVERAAKLQQEREEAYRKAIAFDARTAWLVFDEATDRVPIEFRPGDPRRPKIAALPATAPATRPLGRGEGRSTTTPRSTRPGRDWTSWRTAFKGEGAGTRGSGIVSRTGPTTWGYWEFRDSLFIHGRTAVGGEERLVVVEFDPAAFVATNPSPFIINVFGPPVRLHPMNHTEKWGGVPPLPCPPGTPLRVYSGRADESDPSRFTIRFDAGDRPYRLEGRLGPDDIVRFEIREGAK